jgi:hypothetical protein
LRPRPTLEPNTIPLARALSFARVTIHTTPSHVAQQLQTVHLSAVELGSDLLKSLCFTASHPRDCVHSWSGLVQPRQSCIRGSSKRHARVDHQECCAVVGQVDHQECCAVVRRVDHQECCAVVGPSTSGDKQSQCPMMQQVKRAGEHRYCGHLPSVIHGQRKRH